MTNFDRLRRYIERTAHIHAADPADWASRVMAGRRVIAALPSDIVIGIRPKHSADVLPMRKTNRGMK